MSFDPQNFDAPSGRGGDANVGAVQREGRIRPVPLALTVAFALVAAVSAGITFSLGSANLTSEQQGLQSTLILVGAAAFIGIIFSGRRLVRKR